LASALQDDGFHEIQLNGKQLVFLFMAATVVSVVIFLCGVLVGRGVKTERAVSSADAAAVAAVAEPAPPPAPVTTPPAAGTDPTTAAPPPAVGELTYFNRLEKKTPPAEDLRPALASAAPAEREKPSLTTAPPAAALTTPTPAPAPRSSAAAPPAVAASPTRASASPGAADGYAVQVAAVPEHDADTIARRLTSKGYGVFVVAPGAAAPALYRVRVGKFKTRREAEAVASRLQREEQFKPWITR
jgi:cell division septation protein DedD